MSKTKSLKQLIEKHRKTLLEHELDIRHEKEKARPDDGLIQHQERTIRNIQKQIQKLERRIQILQRRGR